MVVHFALFSSFSLYEALQPMSLVFPMHVCVATPPLSNSAWFSSSYRENEPVMMETQARLPPSPPPSAPTRPTETSVEVTTDAGTTAEDCKENHAATEAVPGKEEGNGVPDENGEEELTSEGVVATGPMEEQQPKEKEEQQPEEKEAGSQTLSKVPQPPKQMSITSLFARQQQQQQQQQEEEEEEEADVTTTHSQTSTDPDNPPARPGKTKLPLISNSLPPAPKLSSVEEFVAVENEKTDRDLTPLERFQQRLMQQMTGAGEHVGRSCGKGQKVEEEREEEDGDGTKEFALKPLISDDVISKLKDKPGGHQLKITPIQ